MSSNRRFRRGGAKREQVAAAATTSTTFKSTVVGLETKVFTFGTAKDAAAFEETKTSIARYVGTQSWRGSAVASTALEMMCEPNWTLPPKPKKEKDTDDDIFKMDVSIWVEEYKEFRSKCAAWEENKARMYNLVLLQCPRALETQLKTLSDWENISSDQDVVELLLLIRDVTHKHDETKQGTMALVESDLLLYLSHMKTGDDPDDFMRLFKAQVDTINAHGGQAGLHPRLLNEHYDELVEYHPKDAKDLTSEERLALTTQARKESCEEYLSCLFIRVADNARYKGLKTTLDNQFLLDKSAYPKELSQALKLLKTFKSTELARPRPEPPAAGGVAFIQQGSDQCFSCGKKGHHAHECPSTSQAEKDA